MAALIDASTGYNVITDYGEDFLENPFLGTWPAAATGPQPYDDFFETNEAEDNLDSGSSLEDPFSGVMPEGIAWDVGTTIFRTTYVKTFEAETAPTLGFSTQFAYLFALILTWIMEFYGTLSFHAANEKSSPRIMLATLSSVGSLATSYFANRIFTAVLSSSAELTRNVSKLLSSAVSFVALFTSDAFEIFYQVLESTLRFTGQFTRTWSLFWSDIWVRINSAAQRISGGFVVLNRRGNYYDTNTTVTTTPSAFAAGGKHCTVFIKNEDTRNYVEVDSSNVFDKFPQLIPPRKGVYLNIGNDTTPGNTTIIYIRATTGSANIKIIAGGTGP